MNREDIVRMAREADDFADSYTPQYVTLPNEWQEIRDKRFAALVAAAEREACAKVCEENAFVDEWEGLAEAARRIRARGQT